MLHTVIMWCLIVAFLGAGLVNSIGSKETQSTFVRWGYPGWWCRLTGALEMTSAVLIALPVTRGAGLALGAAIIAAAILTVIRFRGFTHLAPLSLFVSLLAVTIISS